VFKLSSEDAVVAIKIVAPHWVVRIRLRERLVQFDVFFLIACWIRIHEHSSQNVDVNH
jgi:hypothetical protein